VPYYPVLLYWYINTLICRKFEDNTAKSLKKVMKANKELVKMVKRMNDNKVEVEARTFYQALEGFPFQTIEQFHAFENENSEEKKHDKLVSTITNPLHAMCENV
jgi:predicted site-specific integrase-resolvase